MPLYRFGFCGLSESIAANSDSSLHGRRARTRMNPLLMLWSAWAEFGLEDWLCGYGSFCGCIDLSDCQDSAPRAAMNPQKEGAQKEGSAQQRCSHALVVVSADCRYTRFLLARMSSTCRSCNVRSCTFSSSRYSITSTCSAVASFGGLCRVPLVLPFH